MFWQTAATGSTTLRKTVHTDPEPRLGFSKGLEPISRVTKSNHITYIQINPWVVFRN